MFSYFLAKQHQKECVLISSGSVSYGFMKMNRQREKTLKPAAAATGMASLISIYNDLFSQHGLQVAEVGSYDEKDNYLERKLLMNRLLIRFFLATYSTGLL